MPVVLLSSVSGLIKQFEILSVGQISSTELWACYPQRGHPEGPWAVDQPPAWGCPLAPPWCGPLPAFLMILPLSCGEELNVLWPNMQQQAWWEGRPGEGLWGRIGTASQGCLLASNSSSPCCTNFCLLSNIGPQGLKHLAELTDWLQRGVLGGCFLSRTSVLHLPSARHWEKGPLVSLCEADLVVKHCFLSKPVMYSCFKYYRSWHPGKIYHFLSGCSIWVSCIFHDLLPLFPSQ